MLALVIGMTLAAQPPAAAATPPKTRGVRITEAQPDEAPPTPQPTPSADPPPVPVQRACQRQKADLVYSDSAGFDQALRRLLVANAPPVIDTPDFAETQPPPRLAGWLGEVQRTGGAVSRQNIPCERTRGFSLSKLLGRLLGAHPAPLYLPAKDFDATLWTDKATDMVKQVQFVRRPT